MLIWSVAFSADETRIALGSIDTTVRLWGVASGCDLAQFNGHTE